MNKHVDEILLYEYLENALDEDETVEVANHLSICSQCRQKMNSYKLLFFELEHVRDVQVPYEVSRVRNEAIEMAFESIKVPFMTKAKTRIKDSDTIKVLRIAKPRVMALGKSALTHTSKAVLKQFKSSTTSKPETKLR